jgi:starch phosphorylase
MIPDSIANDTTVLPDAPPIGGAPVSDDAEALRATILSKLIYAVGKDTRSASDHDWFMATALAVRDRIVDRWIGSTRATYREGHKRVYYLSLEF